MTDKKLILPIGTALAALIPTVSEAAKAPVKTQVDSLEIQAAANTAPETTSPVLQRLMYQVGKDVICSASFAWVAWLSWLSWLS